MDTIELVRLAISNPKDEVTGTVGSGDVCLGSSKSLEKKIKIKIIIIY